MKPSPRIALLVMATLFSAVVAAEGCEQFVEDMPEELGGGTTVLTLCCDSNGADCEVYCQDYPMEGEPACPDCP